MKKQRLGFAGAAVLTVLVALAASGTAALAGKAPAPPKVGAWKVVDETGKPVGSFSVTKQKTVVGLKINVPPSNFEEEGKAECPGGVVKVTNYEALVINRGVEEGQWRELRGLGGRHSERRWGPGIGGGGPLQRPKRSGRTGDELHVLAEGRRSETRPVQLRERLHRLPDHKAGVAGLLRPAAPSRRETTFR